MLRVFVFACCEVVIGIVQPAAAIIDNKAHAEKGMRGTPATYQTNTPKHPTTINPKITLTSKSAPPPPSTDTNAFHVTRAMVSGYNTADLSSFLRVGLLSSGYVVCMLYLTSTQRLLASVCVPYVFCISRENMNDHRLVAAW